MIEKGLEQFNKAEQFEQDLEEAAMEQYGQYPKIIDSLERQLENLEAQVDSTIDNDLTAKINDELDLLREELRMWNELTAGDFEVLEITPV